MENDKLNPKEIMELEMLAATCKFLEDEKDKALWEIYKGRNLEKNADLLVQIQERAAQLGRDAKRVIDRLKNG